jgi:hypothetical protein
MMPGTPANVSGMPALPPPPGALGNTGPEYGIQSFRVWQAGEEDARDIVDVTKATFLWRLSVFGNVYVSLYYGTKGNLQLLDLQAPLVIEVPGQLRAIARPRDDQGAECTLTLTQASGGARSQARKFTSTVGALDPHAVAFTALVASVLTISGVVTAVPALATVPLVSGAVLGSGSGFQEFEA